MAISLKHAFSSAKSDGADATLVQPSNWNAEHNLTMATGRLLGRTTASAGAAEEISAGTGLTLASGSLSVTANTYAAQGANTDITSVYLNNTGLKIKDTNASHGLIIAPGSDITADRTLTLTTGDAARTLTISGNATVSQDYSTSGSPQFTTVTATTSAVLGSGDGTGTVAGGTLRAPAKTGTNVAGVDLTIAGGNGTGTGGGGVIAFQTAPAGTTGTTANTLTERMRITSDGYLRLASGGVQFNGDTASTNALNDYEEGTWTVTFYDALTGGNASATTTTGYYTKIGNAVSIWFSINNINTSGMTSGSILYYSLPFSVNANVSTRGISFLDNVTYTSGYVLTSAAASTSRAFFTRCVSGSADINITVGNATSGTADIAVNMTYRA